MLNGCEIWMLGEKIWSPKVKVNKKYENDDDEEDKMMKMIAMSMMKG